jgi:hypothetical protein
VPLSEIIHIGKKAPLRYKVYDIRKRSGGYRRIAQPTAQLKHVQRSIVPILSQMMPVSHAAVAYRHGISLRQNAERHRASRFFIKLDFKDFFNSIYPRDFYGAVGWEADRTGEQKLITHLLFWRDRERQKYCLSVGAPSSPFLSNAILYGVDELIVESLPEGVQYTRYADDMTVSGNDPDRVLASEQIIYKIVADTSSPVLSFNIDKRGFYHPGVKRMVTGLVITPQNEVSLGRDRMKSIRAGVHNFRAGRLSDSEIDKLQGWLAFANDADPDFVRRLSAKYGEEVSSILKMNRRKIRQAD